MSTQFAKPENALKRAEELIGINQKIPALQVLYGVITAKKFRLWQPIYEKIMFKYLDLCVEMRKGKLAKDGLHQYKASCQQTNTTSLEVVVKYFLEQAEEGAKAAQSKADKIVLDIEDLDTEESAESQMLTSVSGEDTKDRTDREVVTPWLKFLWETYRIVLEILRNNNKLETIYQDTAQRAFAFCLRYKRHTEFRRLSEMLRMHLSNLGKYSNQTQAISLNSPETLQQHLDTRFSQLNAATELELWQESFRSIEDIYGLLILSKTKPKPTLLSSYYQKLAQIFWVSENYLFHAYALYKYYGYARSNGTLNPEEQKNISSAVLLAALSVPLDDVNSQQGIAEAFDFTPQKERNARLATLLSFGGSINTNRSALIQELVSRNISSLVLPELKDFYNTLEQKFNPLQFIATVKPKIDFISNQPGLKQYAKALEKLMFTRSLQQLSKVYDTMRIADFQKLVDFLKPFEVERMIVDNVRRKQVVARIDYQNGSINFKYQTLETDQLRNQLSQLTKNLHQALQLINPASTSEQAKAKETTMAKFVKAMKNEQQRIAARKVYLEKKQNVIAKAEHTEKINAEMKKKEEIEKARVVKQAEIEKFNKELSVLRENQRAKEEQERNNAIMIAQLTERGYSEADIRKLEKEKKLNPDALIHKKITDHEQQQAALAQKLKKVSKRLGWLERARRGEEAPLLSEHFEKIKRDDEKFYKDQVERYLKNHKETYEKNLEEKKRMVKMSSDKSSFEEQILKRRQAEYNVLKKERDEKLAVKKAKLAEEKAIRDKEEEEKRKELEAQRKVKEEEDRKKREESDKKRTEDDERRKKLQDMAEMQRRREEEVNERQKKRLEEESRKVDDQKDTAVNAAKPGDRYVPPSRRNDAPRGRDDRRPLSPPRGGGFDRDRRDDRGFDRGFDRRPSPPRGGGFDRDRRDDRGFDRRPSPPRGGFDRDRRPSPPRGGGFDRDRRPSPPRGGGFDRDRRDDRGIDRRDDRGFDRRPSSPPRGGGFDRDRRPSPPRGGGFDRDRRDDRGFDRRPSSPPRGGGFDRDRRPSPPRGGGFDRDRRDDRPKDDRPREDKGPRPDPFSGAKPREQEPKRDDRKTTTNTEKPKEEDDDGFTVVKKPSRR